MHTPRRAFREAVCRHTHRYCDGIANPRRRSHRRAETRGQAALEVRQSHPAANLRWMKGPPCPTESAAGARKIYQPVADSVDHQFSGFVDTQRVHEIGAMYGHRVRTQFERRRNLLVGFPVHDHLQDFQFSWCEMGVALTLKCGRTTELRIEHGLSCYYSPDCGS